MTGPASVKRAPAQVSTPSSVSPSQRAAGSQISQARTVPQVARRRPDQAGTQAECDEAAGLSGYPGKRPGRGRGRRPWHGNGFGIRRSLGHRGAEVVETARKIVQGSALRIQHRQAGSGFDGTDAGDGKPGIRADSADGVGAGRRAP